MPLVKEILIGRIKGGMWNGRMMKLCQFRPAAIAKKFGVSRE